MEQHLEEQNTIEIDTPRVLHLNSSKNPLKAIENISYAGQAPYMKMYKTGFEQYFNSLPVMTDEDENLSEKLLITQTVMKHLSSKIIDEGILLKRLPQENGFDRTIIGLEEPEQQFDPIDNTYSYKEGKEIVVARWGVGFKSPVHGHSAGYMHEEMLKGRMKVNTYQITDYENRVVRPLKTIIQDEGVFISQYVPAVTDSYSRGILVHNFETIEPSVSLHYLPEHTRDGRDNKFTVEHYGETYPLTDADVTRVLVRDALKLKVGDVALVRSNNVPEYGDHFIVITGAPVQKPHDLRPQNEVIVASQQDSNLLDTYVMRGGLTLLKLNKDVAKHFLSFHNIEIEHGEVIFPEA